jgi:hypothetical protein
MLPTFLHAADDLAATVARGHTICRVPDEPTSDHTIASMSEVLSR